VGIEQQTIEDVRMTDGGVATDKSSRVNNMAGTKDMGTPISFAE